MYIIRYVTEIKDLLYALLADRIPFLLSRSNRDAGKNLSNFFPKCR